MDRPIEDKERPWELGAYAEEMENYADYVEDKLIKQEAELKKLRLDAVLERFSNVEIERMAFIKYPRLINDPYNPMDDDNKEWRDTYIEGITDFLNALQR